jgi:hypothetical protein
MVDELDAWLNMSSPQVSMSAQLDAERSALAYATERAARARRGSRLLHFGVPALAGLLVLGGAGAAFGTPAVQRSLGLAPAAVGSTEAPTPVASYAVPYPDCRLTFDVDNGSTAPLDSVGVATISAARGYLASIDQAALLRSPAFWKAFGRPTVIAPPRGANAAEIAQVQQLSGDMNAVRERYALTEAATEALSRYLTARDLNPSVVGLTGTGMNCGEK